MVVGPEFGPVAGLFTRSTELVRMALTTLRAGLVAATAATYGATWLADAAGLVPDEFSPSIQLLTGFIVDPSVLSNAGHGPGSPIASAAKPGRDSMA